MPPGKGYGKRTSRSRSGGSTGKRAPQRRSGNRSIAPPKPQRGGRSRRGAKRNLPSLNG